MRGLRPVQLLLVALALVVMPSVSRADDTDEPDCQPACRLGYECSKGTCVKEVCRPSCRTGFLCVEGMCKSRCNPECGAHERCTPEGECVKLSTERPPDSDDDDSKHELPDAHREKRSTSSKYQPSTTRLYVGPLIVILAPTGPVFTDGGASIAAIFHLDDARTLFLGLRLGVWGDSSGTAVLFDVDFGFRPRLYESADTAVSFVVGGGLGAAYFATALGSVGAFHMPLRLGPCFDYGTFTFEVLLGPALYAGRGAFGAFEGIAEVGARF